MKDNRCFTAFRITGDFDPDVITERLGIIPTRYWKKGDKRRNGSEYSFASWECSRCEEYDVYTENQMQMTIAPLLDKIDILNRIRAEFAVDFTLAVVPTLYVDNTTPALAPSLSVIDFCHATRTEIDIDLYLMDQDGE